MVGTQGLRMCISIYIYLFLGLVMLGEHVDATTTRCIAHITLF